MCVLNEFRNDGDSWNEWSRIQKQHTTKHVHVNILRILVSFRFAISITFKHVNYTDNVRRIHMSRIFKASLHLLGVFFLYFICVAFLWQPIYMYYMQVDDQWKYRAIFEFTEYTAGSWLSRSLPRHFVCFFFQFLHQHSFCSVKALSIVEREEAHVFSLNSNSKQLINYCSPYFCNSIGYTYIVYVYCMAGLAKAMSAIT